ncbi:PSD1 and planctomycete cytochrome C domain-containing protein [Stieleria varia]|uniref:Planctomycete cytochrome C n=1 Tax=Stieleria varia TaxID=2528005 RepID=A0A5C6B9V0_9BACT|nr:PSD1 and planctomycete cytochrome C domain-containing protein [Stieleria varia]TWU08099.1 Planctomycete cytochrome C [Stieleria varia]
MTRQWLFLVLLAVALVDCVGNETHADDTLLALGAESEQFFEQEVRPILVERCSECHGANKQEGGLRVDSIRSLIEPGDSNPRIIPGDINSRLLQTVRREGDLEMPPDTPLSSREIRSLELWVKSGAFWPATLQQTDRSASPLNTGKDHWAFQPIKLPDVPKIEDSSWVQTPVDAWIAEKLAANGLSPSPAADRRTLIRRVTYSLTGLPPTFKEVERFVNDTDPNAYQNLVERLLTSAQYGEHWARHWLDVARYSDTKGYVYAREERFWTHAWTYRDWVVRALNSDMPYDRFLLLQIAADQVDDGTLDDLAAMGFLTLGRRFLGVRRDVIDDRIDVVCRGTMGLTVNCARCHDHKYDPIPTADYYSLYGVFDSCIEQQSVLSLDATDDAFRIELKKRQNTLQENLRKHSDESSQRARERVADYLFAQTELHKYPADGFDQIFQKGDLLPAFVRNWERYLRTAALQNDPIFLHWHAYRSIESPEFEANAAMIHDQLRKQGAPMNAIVQSAFSTPPSSFRDVCDRYGEVFAKLDEHPDGPDKESLRQLLEGIGSPCRVPDGPVSHSETFFDSGTLTELWKLQGEIDRWLNGAGNVPVALALIDQAEPVEPRIFRRGNPLNLGNDIPRQFLSVLSSSNRQPFQNGSGRMELARAIVDPANPLTARVIVNRVWRDHFGTGLVTTPSDFGLRSDPPSHPELLDWLAASFVREGWSLKQLHRWMLLSSTYQQASTVSDDPALRQDLAHIDPNNRLLWRANPRRLTFEELRDSWLRVSGSLDESLGGKPASLFNSPYPTRRTLYGLVDRQYLEPTLRVFDFANPDLHVPERNETTAPQQTLFFMNHPLVLERAKALASLSRGGDADSATFASRLFRQAYQRDPSQEESADVISWLKNRPNTILAETPSTAKDWSYGYGKLDESNQRVDAFMTLPHFTGTAWQGGPAWPDAKLGWVQITANGGHPGNNRNVAAIRRWTAPRNMTVAIQSHLAHEPEAGDGVRAFIVSSSRGVLKSTKIHQMAEDLNVDSLDVKQGETVDFVVDIDEVLNSDQYLWTATVHEQLVNQPVVWNSITDFPSNTAAELDAWEQLAQVILCANEFLFVD